MKTIKDLKIGDLVWSIDHYGNIVEDLVNELNKKHIVLGQSHEFNIPKDNTNLDRLDGKYHEVLCITYLDAVDLATTICLAKIKEHSDLISKEFEAIQKLGSRIHELNDIKQNLV
jgi:hypothetical protein